MMPSMMSNSSRRFCRRRWRRATQRLHRFAILLAC
jgi:hypothetical protein